MSEKLTVLVVGATGGQGSAITHSLLSHGHAVHALVRKLTSPSSLALQKAGATLFLGTFASLPSLQTAATNCTSLFLPSITHPDELIHAQTIISASLAAGINHCILTTATRADEYLSFKTIESNGNDWVRQYWERKKDVQDIVREGFEKWTILQPAWLMSCFTDPVAGFVFPELKTERLFVSSFAKGMGMGKEEKVQVCGYDLIAAFACAALEGREGMEGRVIMLASESLSVEEIAERIGRVVGVDVGVRYRTEEEEEKLKGVSPVVASQIWQRIDGSGVDVEEVRKWGFGQGMSFEEYLVENKEMLKSALGAE